MASRGGRKPHRGARWALLLVAGGLLVSGCTSGGAGEPPKEVKVSTAPPPKPASLELSPAGSVDDFAPGEPVTVSVDDGELTEVSLVGADDTVVKGAKEKDGSGWSTSEKLGYGKTYTLKAEAVGADGKPVTATSTITTATPNRQVNVSLNVRDDQKVGVGMPLIFTFTGSVPDRAAAEDALRVVSEPKTEGAFHWFGDQSVTWRPKEYWKPGTKVTVDAGIYGIDLGDGTFGMEDRSAKLTVGDKVVAVADGGSHKMTVSVNDKVVKTMPLSMGKQSSPTPKGTYTVMSEHRGYTMDSSTYGVPTDSAAGYRTYTEYAVRMSNSGIFYHSAPWSVGQQGNSNVSHGCINLSTANAAWLMETSRPGDIITVKNSGGPELEPTDGWSVWQMPWKDWKSNSQQN
ncbi:peptidoglycan transpeptidase precursor, ErfK-YbiS-YhnG family [Amycolatopsis marina]|uniref:Peptidoglycan transpeptidase, ErfK-YbiS-YhnG family n=1 Tax=Amycolatopsis marina TaxID=490629 RepID=A0A1I0YHT6_9PSEU|nr:Ig-like domain-containing protein [Amycolatopsis marina]SFB13005.1 peptidoglycan transpeptidase precursor, ErfK-YbiS-YhnG family [Amycolatopsis marina]